MPRPQMGITYEQAGVDIDAGERLVERIKPLARSTRIPEVVDDIGGFAGLCGLPSDIEDPLLVSGTDGVGTKIKIAFETGRHDTIGQDVVAMCVNDIITTGARPLFLLDYFACGKLDVDLAESVVRGVADGCKLAGCALLGGETAEMPGLYAEGEYDLAGFALGVVSRSRVLGPARVQPGDAVLLVASSGLHSNGFSLVRRVIAQHPELSLESHVPELGATLGEVLLTPTRIYARAVAALTSGLGSDLHALCHVTGGGFAANLLRVLPEGTEARVDFSHDRAPIFRFVAERGPVEEAELRRTLNLGVGLVALVSDSSKNRALELLREAGEKAWLGGAIAEAKNPGEKTVELL